MFLATLFSLMRCICESTTPGILGIAQWSICISNGSKIEAGRAGLGSLVRVWSCRKFKHTLIKIEDHPRQQGERMVVYHLHEIPCIWLKIVRISNEKT